ncbi:MAG: hypothetical protein AMJ79_09020 [Phycisphaerae bacterium SM23_30]|nr:MAG: hypothetical protein AMJ79_09020 [Phycisphaerae bacterium SM23_30]
MRCLKRAKKTYKSAVCLIPGDLLLLYGPKRTDTGLMPIYFTWAGGQQLKLNQPLSLLQPSQKTGARENLSKYNG